MEKDALSLVNTGVQDGAKLNVESVWPKRVLKPNTKLIENRLQSDTLKVKNIWDGSAHTICNLQRTQDSIDGLRKAVGDLRSTFSQINLCGFH